MNKTNYVKRLGASMALALTAPLSIFAKDLWSHLNYFPGNTPPVIYNAQTLVFSGGGYIGAGLLDSTRGAKNPLVIWRFDSHGDLMWIKQFAQDFQLLQLLDNGDSTFTFSAYNKVPNPIEPPWDWIVTCDASGNVLNQGNVETEQHDVAAADTTWLARGMNGDLYGLGAGYLALKRFSAATGAPLWNIVFDPPGTVSLSKGLRATPDGGVIMISVMAGSSIRLVKTDQDGHVEWGRVYTTTFHEIAPSVTISSTGDLLIALGDSDTGGGMILRTDPVGSVLWLEQLVYPEYPTVPPGYLAGVAEQPDGSLLVWGKTADLPPLMQQRPFLAVLDENGLPLWGQLIGGSAIGPGSGIIYAVSDSPGIVFAGQGRDETIGRTGANGPSLTRLDVDGNGSVDCPNTPIALSARAASVQVQDYPCSAQRLSTIYFKPTSTSPMDVKGLADIIECGEAYPGIMRVKTLQNPFRLKLIGWNFQEGSRAFIDGMEVPATTFQGADSKTNQTKLVLKGGNPLIQMLPKGKKICITVVNPDGRESDCFGFTR